MMKKEFEDLCCITIPEDSYKKIEIVYTYWDENLTKQDIANLYKIGGMDLINNMLPKAQKNAEKEKIQSKHKAIQKRIQELQARMFALHDEDMKLLAQLEGLD